MSPPKTFDFVRPGGQWPNELVPGSSDWQRFDVMQSKSVNGVLGGIWAPTSPIIVGGLGLQSNDATFTGGALTQTGGRVLIAAGAADTPGLYPDRYRTITIPTLSTANVNSGSGTSYSIVASDTLGWGVQPATVGQLFFEIPGRFMHIGARLARASMQFYLAQKSASGLPTNAVFLTIDWSDFTGGSVDSPFGGFLTTNNWSAGLPGVALDSLINPSVQTTNRGYYFQATAVSGTATTGGTEPVWPTVVGATVTDNPGPNQIVWTNVGQNGWYPFFGATPASYWNNGTVQSVANDFLGLGSGSTSNVVNVAWRGRLALTNPDPNAVYTSIQLTFDTIADMRFE